MPEISFEGVSYQSQTDESVLDCLLRHELEVPNSCRNGICQTCLMRAVKGTPPQTSQKGLKPALVAQGYFLACSCVPVEAMEVVLPNTTAFRRDTVVSEVHHFTPDIVRLRLKRPEGFDYCAGQFLTLFHPNGHGRSYSLASLPQLEDYLEFHVHRYPGGKVSGCLKLLVNVFIYRVRRTSPYCLLQPAPDWRRCMGYCAKPCIAVTLVSSSCITAAAVRQVCICIRNCARWRRIIPI